MFNIAIMGFGTIGSGVYDIVKENSLLLEKKSGQEINVAKILDLREFSDSPISSIVVHTIDELTEDKDIALVVEAMGGTSPAYEYVRACLESGKHVVTSNKALVAAYGAELLDLAKKNNVNFLFEASVGGGIPVVRTLTDAYAGEKIKEITGILNGTTNFILTKMDEEGESFSQALEKAQELGYAERNPEADVEGFDTCRKLAILASIASGKEVDFNDIYTEGITAIDKTDFLYADKMGTSIKLFGSAVFEDDKLYAYVCPIMIGKTHILYSVKDVYNGISIEGSMLGKTMLYGSGAGKLPTASAVLADVIACARGSKKEQELCWTSEKLVPEPMDKTSHRYFVRFSGRDKELMDRAARSFSGAHTFMLDGIDEFALLTGQMREKDYLMVASGYDNIIKMIRADA